MLCYVVFIGVVMQVGQDKDVRSSYDGKRAIGSYCRELG